MIYPVSWVITPDFWHDPKTLVHPLQRNSARIDLHMAL